MAINRAGGELAHAPIPSTHTIHVRSKRGWVRVPHALYAQPASAFGTTVVLLFVAIAVLGPWITPDCERGTPGTFAGASVRRRSTWTRCI